MADNASFIFPRTIVGKIGWTGTGRFRSFSRSIRARSTDKNCGELTTASDSSSVSAAEPVISLATESMLANLLLFR